MDKKILHVDISLSGHRVGYLNALLDISNTKISYIPHETNEISGKKIVDKSGFSVKRNLKNYIKFIKAIKRVIKQEKIDIVHFLCGDALYRYFGFYLNTIKCPFIITYHHVQFNTLRNYSLKRLFKVSTCGVVHTQSLKQSVISLGIKNTHQIEYPVFNKTMAESTQSARKYFKLPEEKKILAIMGGTHQYKGLDILLEALKDVNAPFYLLIAGQPLYYKEDYIACMTESYKHNVKYLLKRLSDEEFSRCINAADYIVLPYRKEFDGASGPLVEGVWYRKSIIGAEHGSLGAVIRYNDLGLTFRSEDSSDLGKVLNRVLQDGHFWSEKAESFRKKLTVEGFLKSYRLIYDQISNTKFK